MLPSAGVGLARIEFIISAQIGIHPMALLHPERFDDRGVLTAMRDRLAGIEPREFFVDRLATSIGRIAAAFYPRPVIVRFSDFKTNEYASLMGGRVFEPVESNPMIGFRGASRYYDGRYREGFALEWRQGVDRARRSCRTRTRPQGRALRTGAIIPSSRRISHRSALTRSR